MNSLQPEPCRTYGAAVERRRLGRTEHESSVAILGGAAFWATPSPEEARPSFELALDAGVNHLDIAPQYGNAERGGRPPGAGGAGPAVRGGQDAAVEPRRRGGAVRRHSPPAGVRGPRPLPGARRDRPRRARRSGRRHRPDHRAARSGRHPLRGDHRSRPHRAGHLPRGAAPLGPRHGDVPGVPAAVGRPRVPRRCRGAAGHVRGARRRRDGHQGGGPPTVGRRSLAGRVAGRRPGHRRRVGRRRGTSRRPATTSFAA